MKAFLRTAAATAALTLAAAAAHAIEFRSVSEAAILYDSPSQQGKRLFIVSAGTPVEVVVDLDNWVKVRDAGGAITWIERRALSPQRTLMVTAASAVVRQRPERDAPPVFEAARDVVLEMAAPPAGGWVQVRHRDGASGFVRVTEVWGL
jgi:SH3-like domain-containing protein